MKNLHLFIIIACCSFSLCGQTISGVVLDAQTNKPLAGAHVYLSSIDEGTVTNYRGKFRLKYVDNSPIDSVYVSHVGYIKKTFLYAANKRRYIIYLESKSNILSEVQLSGVQRQLNPQLRYNKLTSMKKGLYSFGSTLKDDKIFVVGGNAAFKENSLKRAFEEQNPQLPPNQGFDALIRNSRSYFTKDFYRGDLLIYDLNLDLWEAVDVTFRKRAHHNLHYYDNKFYVLGGKRLSRGRKYEYLDDKIEVYDSTNQSIQVDDTNPHQAVDFASFTYDDKLIIMGGSMKQKKSGQKVYTNKVHLYDLKTGLWFEMASMPTAKEAKGVRIEDTIYLIGGASNESLSSIETFDLISGKWNKIGELFQSFSKPAVTRQGNVIYAFENGKMIRYDTTTNELSQYHIDLDLKGSQLFYANNKLYILGGYREKSYATIPSPNLYSIDIKEFETTKPRKSKTL